MGMPTHLLPKNEAKRMDSLRSYGILDSDYEESFEAITDLAKGINDCPVALISILDKERQWFKSHKGTSIRESNRKDSFCTHAILNPEAPLIIEDAELDERFKDSPLVVQEPKFRSYLGIPLVNKEQMALGSLCILDFKPRKFEKETVEKMQLLSVITIDLLENYRRNRMIKDLITDMDGQKERLNQFAAKAAHDLKGPVRSIQQLIDLLGAKIESGDSEKAKEIMSMIKDQASGATEIVDSSLGMARNVDRLKTKKGEMVELKEVIDEIESILRYQYDRPFKLAFEARDFSFRGHKMAYKRILLNIFSNSIKHSDKEEVFIELIPELTEGHVKLQIDDNGPGIARHLRANLFELYTTGKGKKSTSGIGLNTVKGLVDRMNGEVEISTNQIKGARFTLRVPLAN